MRKNYNVLVVDDDKVSVFIAVDLIRRMGVADQIFTAHSGLVALDILKDITDRGELPQLILLDINMPEMDGFAFLEELEKIGLVDFHRTKIVLFSSLLRRAYMEKAAFYPVAFYLQKPLTEEKLKAVID